MLPNLPLHTVPRTPGWNAAMLVAYSTAPPVHLATRRMQDFLLLEKPTAEPDRLPGVQPIPFEKLRNIQVHPMGSDSTFSIIPSSFVIPLQNDSIAICKDFSKFGLGGAMPPPLAGYTNALDGEILVESKL